MKKKHFSLLIGSTIIILAIVLVMSMGEIIQFFRWFPDINRYNAEKELNAVLGRAIAAHDANTCYELPYCRRINLDGENVCSTGARGTIKDCIEQFDRKINNVETSISYICSTTAIGTKSDCVEQYNRKFNKESTLTTSDGVHFWQSLNSINDQTTSEEIAPSKLAQITIEKPIITAPANSSIVVGPTVKIKGTAKPNSKLWAYINYSTKDRTCISINSYANGGAGQADAKGNFEFTLAEPCSKDIEVFVSAVDPNVQEKGDCRDNNSLSYPVKFTISGQLPDICNQ